MTDHKKPQQGEKMSDDLKLYHHAVNKFGVENQLGMMVEECAELILAVRKYIRNSGPDTLRNLAEECADVEIMCAQVRAIVGPLTVDRIKRDKIKRMEQFIYTDDDPDEQSA